MRIFNNFVVIFEARKLTLKMLKNGHLKTEIKIFYTNL